jgi:acetylornithine/N-succinyldiaminopimelate aminotransferase
VNAAEILQGVLLREQWFREQLTEINQKYQVFSEIRGKGLLIGAALSEQYAGRARDFLQAAVAEGTMMLIAGPNVLRFTPSLIIPQEDVTEGLARFERAVAKVVAGQ